MIAKDFPNGNVEENKVTLSIEHLLTKEDVKDYTKRSIMYHRKKILLIVTLVGLRCFRGGWR